MELPQGTYQHRFCCYWEWFCKELNIPEKAAADVLRELLRMYGEEGRFYHGIPHPVLLLDAFFIALEDNPGWDLTRIEIAAIVFAIFLHDLFYDATRRDNEERSAQRAHELAIYLTLPDFIQVRSPQMVRATEHESSKESVEFDLLTQIVLDLDLSLLACQWEEFAKNTDRVRKEYGHVPDEQWKLGRPGFLKTMRDRKRIFRTAYFHRLLEARAKENINRSIEQFAA